MHVAMITTFPPQSCGIASYSKYLVDGLALVEPGLQISVLTEYGASAPNSARILPCFDAGGDYDRQLLRRLERLNADAVHIQHEYGIFGFDERFLRLLQGIQDLDVSIALTMHTVHTALSFDVGCSWRDGRPPIDSLVIEAYQRDACNLVDAVIAHQEAPMRQVLIRQGVAPGRVRTIPHATLVQDVGERRLNRRRNVGDPDAPHLLAFGYFEPSKNVLILLEAFSRLQRDMPRAQLLVGGHIRFPNRDNLSYFHSCQRAVEELGLSKNVTFMDKPVPESDIESLFAWADVACFVYDEDSRSSSGAIHRAIGCGVPVIASRISKFSEIAEISDELLVDPRSASAVAKLLNRVLKDDDFQSHIAGRAASFAAATSWERVATRHAHLYHDLSRRRESAALTRVWSDELVP